MTVRCPDSILPQFEALFIRVGYHGSDFIFRDFPKPLLHRLHHLRPGNETLGVESERILLWTMAEEIG